MTTRNVHQWMITAPQETFEAILDVTCERSRQEDRGYTPQHDDEQGALHLLEETVGRLNVVGYDLVGGPLADATNARTRIIQCAALLVAAAEALDRNPSGSGSISQVVVNDSEADDRG